MFPCVHPLEIRAEVVALSAHGLSDREVAEKVGIPRRTVSDIRRGVHQDLPLCPRCWRRSRPVAFTPLRYAELLGLYLGDGCISRQGRSWRLRIALDTKYPRVVARAQDLLRVTFSRHRVGAVFADEGSTVVLHVYDSHLPCLFPQHGAGKKHLRRINLEGWQWACVEVAPWAFLRGCLWSDGCRFVNRTGRYAYPSYDFSNRSCDILDLFAWTCDGVGVSYRRYPRSIRIYQRASVALLDEHVGPKN